MSELDLTHLRPWLDEQENYTKSIKPDDPGTVIAQQMLAMSTRSGHSLFSIAVVRVLT